MYIYIYIGKPYKHTKNIINTYTIRICFKRIQEIHTYNNINSYLVQISMICSAKAKKAKKVMKAKKHKKARKSKKARKTPRKEAAKEDVAEAMFYYGLFELMFIYVF